MGFVGAIIVLVCVFGGFLLAGGHLHVIWQPFEVLIIVGAAFGGMVIGNSLTIVKKVFSYSLKALSGHGPGKRDFMDLLQLLFKLFQTLKKGGTQLVEKHIEEPQSSEIFKAYPSFMKREHAVDFLCDTMKVILSADLTPYDLEDLLDYDIRSSLAEKESAQHAVQTTADALPGLGIVAAVLGIVHTMQFLDQGFQTIGGMVAAALVGTFLGVLLCYGFAAPVATKIAHDIHEENLYLIVIKASLIALQKEASPLICVEFGRRTIPPLHRPTFEEVDQTVRMA